MVLVMRLKEIRALEPHLSFPNLVLRDTNSANFPGHRATERDGDGDGAQEPENDSQTILPPPLAFHAVRGTSKVTKGDSQSVGKQPPGPPGARHGVQQGHFAPGAAGRHRRSKQG